MGDAETFRSNWPLHFGPERRIEAELRPEINMLPVVRVKAGDPQELLAKGYRPGKCHENCREAAREMPGVEQVFGWSVSDYVYVSHSVLRMPDGSLHCITPEHSDELDGEGYFRFAPDTAFTWERGGMCRAGIDCTEEFGVVRRDVKLVQRAYNKLLGQLRRGEVSIEEAEKRRL